jgi:hypothetical protein
MKKALILAAMTGLLMLTASLAFAIDEEQRPNRVGLSGGFLWPSGSYMEPDVTLDYKNGATFGVDYRRLLTKNFGVGGFLGYNSLSSGESKTFPGAYYDVKAKVDVSSILFGVSASWEVRISDIVLCSAIKLGMATSTINREVTYRNNTYGYSVTDSQSAFGTAPVIMPEFGVRYLITEAIDIGIVVNYSYIPQEVEITSLTTTTKTTTYLGGVSTVVSLGFNF